VADSLELASFHSSVPFIDAFQTHGQCQRQFGVFDTACTFHIVSVLCGRGVSVDPCVGICNANTISVSVVVVGGGGNLYPEFGARCYKDAQSRGEWATASGVVHACH
jgi:hypothetical protein